VATGFGSGYLKPAPGTWGSLASIPFWLLVLLLCRFGGGVVHSPWWLRLIAWELPLAAALVAYGWLAVRASGLVEQEAQRKDPGFIVADEWIGMGIALWPVRNALALWPGGWDAAPRLMNGLANFMVLAVPFVLFRLFDIWKPWPCKKLQDLGGGIGVVLDDVAAGVYAAIGTALLLPFF
jgi:phosphatidylglycerophosphatase A